MGIAVKVILLPWQKLIPELPPVILSPTVNALGDTTETVMTLEVADPVEPETKQLILSLLLIVVRDNIKGGGPLTPVTGDPFFNH